MRSPSEVVAQSSTDTGGHRTRKILLVAAALIVGGCKSETSSLDTTADNSTTDNASITVVATSYPVFVMAAEIAGDACDVVFPAEEATSAETWNPTEEDIGELQSADLILLNGAGYEPWAQKVSLPRSRTADTSIAIESQLRRVQDAVTHQHGPRGEGAGGTLNWSTWLDPRLAIQQLKAIETALARLMPERRDEFAARSRSMADRLEELDQKLEQLAAATADKELAVICFGSDVDYLTERLGWSVKRVPKDAGAETVAQAMADAAADQATLGLRILLHDARRNDLSDAGSGSGFKPVRIDLCHQPDSDSTLWDRMRGNIERLARATDLQ